MAMHLAADQSSVGVENRFAGNFTKAIYLRSQPASEIERRLGYGAGRLARGWWLLFALEKPSPDNFEYGGYTHFSGGRIGHPSLGNARPSVETGLRTSLRPNELLQRKRSSIAALQIVGPERLAKVLPVAAGSDYPVGTGVFQCNIPAAVRCKVAAFVPPGGMYLGNYA